MRGTPQQIIEKYSQLARDGHLSNDRVAAENFQQHAEHYTRMLSEAQREQDARREQQEQQNRERQQQPREQHADNRPQPTEQPAVRQEEQTPEAPARAANDVMDMSDTSEDSGLVETPEEKPAPKRRAPRKPRPPREAKAEDAPEVSVPEAPAAE